MKEQSHSPSALLRDAPPIALFGKKEAIDTYEIRAVFCDSREAEKFGRHGLFVCISGATFDGHDFARTVYDAGCRLFAVSRQLDLPTDAIQLLYTDTRQALALLSASFYGHPSRELTVIGVTGTKGKTTTCLLAQDLLLRAGIPTGYIGTSGIRYADRAYDSPNTTPESLILQRTMRDMLDSDIRVLVMEVSSQALMQHRVHGIAFRTVLFTNLSKDHIGPLEHPSLQHYKETKRTLFTDYGAKKIILNADDPASEEMLPSAAEATVEAFSVCGCESPSDVLPKASLIARNAEISLFEDGRPGISFLLEGEQTDPRSVFLPLPGECNVHNALAALMIAKDLGVPLVRAADALRDVRIPGRCETVKVPNGASVIIDYAHNEASLREILSALRAYRPKRLIVLFGSVGGRTRNRRRPMGAVASALADLCILTSDNPDFESPEGILAEIREGITNECPYVTIPDRADAIRYGLSILSRGDILLLAGKGHETYQLVCGKKLPFSEREIVEAFDFGTQNA